MIVKVQRPVVGNTPPDIPSILVYGEGRKHLTHVFPDDLPAWLVKALDLAPKTFAHAVWSLKRGWEFTGPAEWQEW